MGGRQKILILGGSGFFGAALCEKFAEHGYAVEIADLVPPGDGRRFDAYHQVDVTCHNSLNALRQTLDERAVAAPSGSISHIINLVGGLKEAGLTNLFHTTAQEIEDTIGLNLKAQIYPVRFLGEHLAANPASDKSFTLMSSINAQAGYSIPFYTAAKGGLDAFVRPAAVDLGRHGIRINTVASGSVVTPSTAAQPKNFTAREQSAPLKRLASPDDVAEAFLSCVRMKAFTGQTLVVDCGQSVHPSESLYDQRRHGLVI